MRIVLAPNAFKDCMTAHEAADAMAEGVKAVNKEIEVIRAPVSDGGDGLTEVLIDRLGGEVVSVSVNGPRMQEILSVFGYISSQQLAIVEMAKASGLALLSPELRDPTQTTTCGTGQLIKSALEKGAKKIVIGVGGSATCDGGIGMAAALGYRFLDNQGNPVEPIGGNLSLIRSIDCSGVDARIKDQGCNV